MNKVKEETKCEFYDNYECNAYYDIYPEPEDCQRDLCRTHEDCYYRQLKRLKQENKRLKAEFKNYKTSKENSYQNLQKEWQQCQWDIRKLTTENERLKSRLRPLEDSYFNGLSSIEIAELAKKSIRITAENRKLEDALQDIKVIANTIYNTNCNYIAESHKIIDKINEVIGVE